MKLIQENFSSKNLFNKICILSEGQQRRIETGIEWIMKEYPTGVIVGGVAVVNYISGSRALTPDLDVLVSNINKVQNILDDNGIKYSSLNTGSISNLGITVDKFNTDFLNSKIGNKKLNDLILSTSVKSYVYGYEMNIINPELLAIMKIELGRDKDLGDGIALLQSGKINKGKYIDYIEQLKNSLSEYSSLYSYRSFIV